MGVLTVLLDKCLNLKDADGPMNKSDPYVMFTLTQDNWGPFDKNFGKAESTHKKGDCNPVYNETFTFEIPSLKNMVLHVKVKDEDWGLDDKLGWCKIKLDELGLSATPTGIERTVDNNVVRKDGKIYLQLSYTE
jgi:Ca2+-dependent lipid-binding protein